ncbi:MAG: hypothetical protein ACJ71S_05665, partial [Acidobacteriaceae bacterium]
CSSPFPYSRRCPLGIAGSDHNPASPAFDRSKFLSGGQREQAFLKQHHAKCFISRELRLKSAISGVSNLSKW